MANTADGSRFYVGQRVQFVGEDERWTATVRKVAKNGQIRVEFWGRSKLDFNQLRVIWVSPRAIEVAK